MHFIKFFILGVACGAGLWIALFYALLGTPGESTGGIAETYGFKKQVMEQTSAPRLVILGGSGTLMGVGAEILHDKLKIPVVNFGIFAGFDLDYQFRLLEPLLQDGDVILLSFEYSSYAFTGEMSANTRNYIMERDPEYFRAQNISAELQQIFTMGPGIMAGMVKAGILPTIERQRMYPTDKLNEFGDQTINRIENNSPNLPQPDRLEPENIAALIQENAASWAILSSFIEEMRTKKRVGFLATFPNTLFFPDYEKPEFIEFTAKIASFYTHQGVPVLGSAAEFMYPIQYLYDTVYHLNASGVMKRSEQLAALLQSEPLIIELQTYWAAHPSQSGR